MKKERLPKSRAYVQGLTDGVLLERARIKANHAALRHRLTRNIPVDPTLDSIIDLAIRQVITGDELGRSEKEPSDQE
jgi:hypothetical protein